MAATAPTSTSQAEPFPPLDTAASTAAVAAPATTVSNASSLLQPPTSPRANNQSAGGLPKPDKRAFSPRTSPIALTGAAAMAELKRRNQDQQQQTAPLQSGNEPQQMTPNPAVEAMHSLLGGGGVSKPSDGPAPDKLSEPLRKAAEKMHVSDDAPQHDAEQQQASPVSLASFGSAESSGGGHTATANAQDTSSATAHLVAEPGQMADGPGFMGNNGNLAPDDQDGSKAFSYPGPPQQDQGQEGGPSRGMSLPGYGQSSPRSPASNKRHKCPYCSTDFTRHHNLKSHLLTHSQEKPYVCQTCQARFRRLHDLKRHTKLHTGERPHTCDKCGRRFARGDALARHNKGPGGCAGRRSSFGGEDDYGPDGSDPSAMDGIEYAGGDDEDETTDAHGRRISEPTRKRQQLETAQDSNREVYRQHSSTYPPAPNRGPRGSGSIGGGGGMGPPTVVHPGSSAANSPHEMSGQPSPAGGSSLTSSNYGSGQVFAEPTTMTPSPKPLSPRQPVTDQHRLSAPETTNANSLLGRNRSTSLSTQLKHAHFGRNSTGRTPPPASSQFSTSQAGGSGLLPPLNSSNNSSHMRGGPTFGMPGHQQLSYSGTQIGNQGSNPGSLSSQGRSSGSSIRDIAGQDPSEVWNYVRLLEQRFGRMQDEFELRISRLQEEVISLKGQVSNIASYSSDMGSRY